MRIVASRHRALRLGLPVVAMLTLAGCLRTADPEVDVLRLHMHAADLALFADVSVRSHEEQAQARLTAELGGMRAALAHLQQTRNGGRADKAAPLLQRATAAVDTLQRSARARQDASEAARRAMDAVPQMAAQLFEVVRVLGEKGATTSELNIANRQIVLAERMSRRLTEILAGGEASVTTADAFRRDLAVFTQVLAGLRDGNADMGLKRVESPGGQYSLGKVAELLGPFSQDAALVVDADQAFMEAELAAAELRNVRRELYDAAPPRD